MRTNLDEMASNVSYSVVQLTEKDVSGQRLCISLSRITVQVCTMLHLQRWLECRGIKRSGTKSLFMIISHLSIIRVPSTICYNIGIYSIKNVVVLHIHTCIRYLAKYIHRNCCTNETRRLV